VPYIKQTQREVLVESIDGLIEDIHQAGLTEKEIAGVLNYTISSLLKAMKPDSGWNYAACNNTIGVLECAKQEFYRRVISPYEDKKILENGDIDYGI
jgi:hypothetical protein